MVNFQKCDFIAIFNNKFCDYRSARIERKKHDIASYPQFKARKARDLDEVSSGLTRMSALCQEQRCDSLKLTSATASSGRAIVIQ